MEDAIKRSFYIEMCKLEKWSVRVFQERINSLLYERTAISKKPEQTILNELELLKAEQKVSPDLVFRDPYFLDFLGLSDTYSEKDLETGIIVELQRFITEMGSDFAFLGRQKNRSYRRKEKATYISFVSGFFAMWRISDSNRPPLACHASALAK